MAVSEAAIEQLMGQLVGYMTGAAMCLSIWLGDELGFYRVLAGAGGGGLTADELATQANTNPRLTREWLDAQASGNLVAYNESDDTYSLAPENAMALADDTAPIFVARAMNAFGSMFIDIEKVKGAFKGFGGLSWGDHDHRLFSGTEWFFRPGYRAFLPDVWIPALTGVVDKLDKGAKVADVGCGHGASSIVMADRWPASHFTGFDFHPASIEASKERAAEAGVSGNTTFEVADAKSYQGTFDLICFFDCLHDMGDPVGIAKYAREHLAEDGTVLLVEPAAMADRLQNIRENPMAPLLYTASSVICTPNSLSQEVGLGLGAQAGPEKLKAVLTEAGFSHFRIAEESPLNLVIEAKA
jgi:2-polyprenyl-3-methyl-5-hydroxy-6-metoxy-1,4-benzoquinol methylase